jgi:SAM-dependent methyltransferase
VSRASLAQLSIDSDDERVVREIAPEDQMFGGSERAYFALGRDALDAIALGLALSPKHEFKRILDLPCGFGRVLRWLQVAFPASEIVACDIQRAGVDFCADRLGAVPVYSSEDPVSIDLPGEFDLIWCGSLFTHVDAPRWKELLELFRSKLAPYGVFVFTTHGRGVAFRLQRGIMKTEGWLGNDRAARLVEDYERTGFGYQDYPVASMDFPGQERPYGWSLSAPEWVTAQVAESWEWRLIGLQERGWRDYQDVVTCLKEPADERKIHPRPVWVPPEPKVT